MISDDEIKKESNTYLPRSERAIFEEGAAWARKEIMMRIEEKEKEDLSINIPPQEPVDVIQPTILDQFAMSALNGLLADSWPKTTKFGVLANCAYGIAEAMMQERERRMKDFAELENRYKYDNTFSTLVDTIYNMITSHRLTPSEIRDAIFMAQYKFEQLKPYDQFPMDRNF